ncbi:HIT family protein [Pantoea agglomerans]|uniref:HIT family protein n=1 Tax=Enterobacter agglomerans TaxID=549 RepID=UPI003D291CBE
MLSTSHEPAGYSCPFCRFLQGIFDERNLPSDVIGVTDRAYARIAPKWWPGNPGAVYDLSPEVGRGVWELTQQVAIGMRSSYDCEGTSIRQHNEPAGNQDVWHLHVHVFPRHADDRLYQRQDEARWVSPSDREPFALQLREALGLPFTFN